MKYSNKILQNRSFTYRVIDYNSLKKEYTLENPITKELKIMSKEDFDMLYDEQNKPEKKK